MSLPLAGRLALITGAGSGIGRATSNILARDGAIIVAADRNIKAANETVSGLGSGSHLALEMDVGSSESISSAIAKIQEKYNAPARILVNSAGITKDNFFMKLSEADFDAVININLKGTFLVAQNFAKALIDQKQGGSIINISSIVAKWGNIGQSNYAPSKAGVECFTRVTSKELARYNIRVNTVVPGFINSPMTKTVPDKVKELIISQCAMRRFGEPEEIAEVVAFLASDKSSYVNGTAIEVTGG